MRSIAILASVLLLGLLALGQGSSRVDAQGDPLPDCALARLGTLRYRHDAGITCQAVSNDGKLVATGGGRSVRVWEAATGRQIFVLTINQNGRAAAPSAVAFSPDSQMLAALGAYGQGVLMVWDLRGGQARQEMQLPQRDDYSNSLTDAPFLAFTGNKQLLVKNYSDRSVRMFDVSSGQELKAFQDGASSLSTIATSPDGNWLAAGTENRQVILWDLKQSKEVRRLTHEYPLVNLAFSRNGQYLATMDQDLAPRIWEVATGKEYSSLPARTRSTALAWSSDDQSLLVARQPDQIVRWNLADKKEQLVSLPRGWVNGPLLSYKSVQDKEAVILGSSGRRGANFAKLRRSDLNQFDNLNQFDGYDSGSIFPFYLSTKKQWASIGSNGDDTLRYWSEQGKVANSVKLPITEQLYRSFAVDAHGKYVALSCSDGRILVIDALAGKLAHSIAAFTRACYDTEFSSDGETLIATDLRQVKTYDLKTGKELKSYEISAIDPMRTIISSDGTRIATLAYQQEDEQLILRILDARTGKVLTGETRLPVQQQSYYFSPDGRNIIFLANRGRTGGINVVEAASGKTRFQAELPAPYVYQGNHARISPDGRWLVASASGNDTEQYAAVAWNFGSKKEPVILQGHRGSVLSLNFSFDSRQLLTVSNDTTMLVWEMARHQLPTPPALDEKGYARLWQDLGNQDANKAYFAIHRLAQYPQAATWLSKQITDKLITVQPELIKDWISKLNAIKFSEREEASRQLIKNAALAKPFLKTAIEQTDSAETKRRLEQIIEQARESTGLADNPLQCTRAIEAMELIGDQGALRQLQLLADRKDAIGNDAREAALRLKNRVQ